MFKYSLKTCWLGDQQLQEPPRGIENLRQGATNGGHGDITGSWDKHDAASTQRSTAGASSNIPYSASWTSDTGASSAKLHWQQRTAANFSSVMNPLPPQMFPPWPNPPGYPFQNNPAQHAPNGQYFPVQPPTGHAPPAFPPAFTNLSINPMPAPPQAPWHHFHPQQSQQPPPFPGPQQQPPQQPQPPIIIHQLSRQSWNIRITRHKTFHRIHRMLTPLILTISSKTRRRLQPGGLGNGISGDSVII